MADTASITLALGFTAPSFALNDFDGKPHSLGDFKSAKGLVVAFICPHCPFVKHIRAEFSRLARQWQAQGIAVIAISSNDTRQYPQDGPDGMRAEAQTVGYSFPYLFDEAQNITKAFKAVCTPDFYLFDGAMNLFYHGQFDGSRPSNSVPVTGANLNNACEALLAGKQPPSEQWPSMGCGIKWKPGNEPA